MNDSIEKKLLPVHSSGEFAIEFAMHTSIK